MTRSEEICKAAYDSTKSDEDYVGFLKGAQWADEHPKSPWILITEKPIPNDEENYLVRFCNGAVENCYISNGVLKNNFAMPLNEDMVVAWMPIPDLPKAE